MNSNNKLLPLHTEKVLIFGDKGVGKTSLISIFQGKSILTSTPQLTHESNTEIFCESKCEISSNTNSRQVNIQFIEVNSIETNQIILPPLLFNCKLVLFVYNQSRYETFIKIKNIAHFFDDIKINKILIANKTDVNHNDIIETELKAFLNCYKTTMQHISISNINKANIIALRSMIQNILNTNDTLVIEPCYMPKESISLFKIILFGDTEVGKTSFFKRFFSNAFSTTVVTTIGLNEASFCVKIDSTLYQIQIWDTAGQERFRSITKLYYNKADGIIMMFDLTQMKTFSNLEYWVKELNEYCIEGSKKWLIGSKVDLINERKVRYNDAVSFAQKCNMTYCEVSSHWNLNVSNCIFSFIKDIYSNMKDRENKQGIMLNNSYMPRSWCCI